MQLEERDAALIWDIVQACHDIIEFTTGLNFHQFENNKMVRYAVERQILVIGEAAKQLSCTLTEQLPDIPWKAIVAQRNVLAHEYGDILVERVWRVIQEHIPTLASRLEPLLPPLPPTVRS